MVAELERVLAYDRVRGDALLRARQEAADNLGGMRDQMEEVAIRDARIVEEHRLRMKATAAATEAEARIEAVRGVLDREAPDPDIATRVRSDMIRRALDGV